MGVDFCDRQGNNHTDCNYVVRFNLILETFFFYIIVRRYEEKIKAYKPS